jgi:predicted Zn-dependent protease
MWHDPGHRLEKAIQRYAEGDLAAARAMLRALDRQGVISPRIDLFLGHCHLHDDRPEAALRRYRRAAALAPKDAAPWIGIGLCHVRGGRFARARKAFLRAVRLDPRNEEAHCHLVYAYGLAGRLDRAARHARRVLELDPGCAYVHRHLAVAYAVGGRPEQALASWRRFGALLPDHPDVGLGMARAYADLRRWPDARRLYLRAVAEDRKAEGHHGLGEVAREEGDLEEAADRFRRALEADPDLRPARVRWAETLADLGRLEEAWDVLRPIHASLGRDLDGAATAARVLHELGRRSQAVALLRHLARRSPGRVALARLLGAQLLSAGRPRAARRVLERAVRARPRNPEGIRLLARALSRCGEARRAVSMLARACHRPRAPIALHLDTVAAHLARGRDGAAERAALRSCSAHPTSPDLWAAAAELALERGDRALARHRLRTALRCDRRHGAALSLLVRWLLEEAEPLRAAHAGRAASRVLRPGDRTNREHGRALLRAGRPAEAAIVLRRFVLAAPEDAEGYRLLARALEFLGDGPGARAQQRIASAVVQTAT